MKSRFTLNRLTLTALGVLAIAPLTLTHAQDTAVTTSTASSDGAATSVSTQTTTSAGTMQEFTPGSSRLIIRTSAGAPVTYAYSKRTTFVDAEGNTVSSETIRPGVPTTVYYTMEAGAPVVSKVVVSRTVTAPVTTTQVQPATVVVPAVPVTHTEKTETTTTTTGGK